MKNPMIVKKVRAYCRVYNRVENRDLVTMLSLSILHTHQAGPALYDNNRH